MKVVSFEIEESKVNKGSMLLIAIGEDGTKYVVAGDPYYCSKLEPYEKAWDVVGDGKIHE